MRHLKEEYARANEASADMEKKIASLEGANQILNNDLEELILKMVEMEASAMEATAQAEGDAATVTEMNDIREAQNSRQKEQFSTALAALEKERDRFQEDAKAARAQRDLLEVEKLELERNMAEQGAVALKLSEEMERIKTEMGKQQEKQAATSTISSETSGQVARFATVVSSFREGLKRRKAALHAANAENIKPNTKLTDELIAENEANKEELSYKVSELAKKHVRYDALKDAFDKQKAKCDGLAADVVRLKHKLKQKPATTSKGSPDAKAHGIKGGVRGPEKPLAVTRNLAGASSHQDREKQNFWNASQQPAKPVQPVQPVKPAADLERDIEYV